MPRIPLADVGDLTTFGRDRGTGTALPSTDLRRGDVYFHIDQGCLFVYTGTAWRQAHIPTSNAATAPLYDGQYRDHPTKGLQRGAGGAWQPAETDTLLARIERTTSAGPVTNAVRTIVEQMSAAPLGPTFTLARQTRVRFEARGKMGTSAAGQIGRAWVLCTAGSTVDNAATSIVSMIDMPVPSSYGETFTDSVDRLLAAGTWTVGMALSAPISGHGATLLGEVVEGVQVASTRLSVYAAGSV